MAVDMVTFAVLVGHKAGTGSCVLNCKHEICEVFNSVRCSKEPVIKAGCPCVKRLGLYLFHPSKSVQFNSNHFWFGYVAKIYTRLVDECSPEIFDVLVNTRRDDDVVDVPLHRPFFITIESERNGSESRQSPSITGVNVDCQYPVGKEVIEIWVNESLCRNSSSR